MLKGSLLYTCTALQPASDMNSLKGGVEALVTVTANAAADVLNVNGVSPTVVQSVSDMNSAEVGAAGKVAVDAAEVSSVTVTSNATVFKDNSKTEARVHDVYQPPSDMDSVAGKAAVERARS